MRLAKMAFARVEPLLAGMGMSQQGVSMRTAISRAAVSKSVEGLRWSLMA